MNRVGIPDVLQQLQVGHGAPVLCGAPVNFESTMTVTGEDLFAKVQDLITELINRWLFRRATVSHRRRPLEQGFPVIAEESQRFVRNWFCADLTWCC